MSLLLYLAASSTVATSTLAETATVAAEAPAIEAIEAAPIELDETAAGPLEVPAAPSTSTASYDVTVVGTRLARTPGSAHVIKPRQMERFEYDDPHTLLATVPGVYSRGEDGVGLRPNLGIRGANPDRSKKVALLEDGILFAPAPYSAPAAYYFPLLTRMTAVRVIKGPAAISYGPQTVGGSVDFMSRSIPASRALAVDLAGGEMGYAKAHGYFGTTEGDLGILLEGAHIRENGFKQLPGGEDTGFYRNEWIIKGSYPTGDDSTLRLKLGYSDELSNETYLGLGDQDFRADPLLRYGASKLDRMTWHRTTAVLSHDLDLGGGLTLSTAIYRHDLSRVWRKVNGFRGAPLFRVLSAPEDPTNAVFYELLSGRGESSSPGEVLLIGPNQRDFVSQGIESRLRFDFSSGPLVHRIEGGLRLHYDRVERRHSEDGFFLVRGELLPEGSATVVTAFNEASTIAGAGHLVDAVTIGALTVTPGLRVEILRSRYIDRLSGAEQKAWAHVLLPGAGAYLGLTRTFGVLAGVYRGFSPPAPGEENPELSTNYEAGLRFSKSGLRAEVIGFFNDYTNLTDICTLSSGCTDADLDRQFSAGHAKIYGLEAYFEHEPQVSEKLSVPINLSYTLTRAEFLNSFQSDDPIFGDVEAGFEVPYVPRHQARLSIGLESSRASLAAGVTYVSRMREQAGNLPLDQVLATDEQVIVDLSGSYKITDSLSIYSNARNLLDQYFIVARRPFGARSNAPRWLQIGLKASLF